VCRNRTISILFNKKTLNNSAALKKCKEEQIRVEHKSHAQHKRVQGLFKHHLKFFTQAVKYKIFMNKQDLEDDIYAFDKQDRQNP